MKISVHNRCSDFSSYRAARVKSLFNAETGANFDLEAELPIDDVGWALGVVVGPSGSGKTSVGRGLWGADAVIDFDDWPADKPIIDAIAPEGDFDEVAGGVAAVRYRTVTENTGRYRPAGNRARAAGPPARHMGAVAKPAAVVSSRPVADWRGVGRLSRGS